MQLVENQIDIHFSHVQIIYYAPKNVALLYPMGKHPCTDQIICKNKMVNYGVILIYTILVGYELDINRAEILLLSHIM